MFSETLDIRNEGDGRVKYVKKSNDSDEIEWFGSSSQQHRNLQFTIEYYANIMALGDS